MARPRKNNDSELDFHQDVTQRIMTEEGYATAQDAYDNCWKLQEWRERLQSNPTLTMEDCARWVWDSLQAGTWEPNWTLVFFWVMGNNMPPTLRAHLVDNLPAPTAASIICRGRGSLWFSNQELIFLKPKLVGVYMDNPGRHFIDDIPDG